MQISASASPIFHWLVEWGLGGVVAGVVGLIMPVGCNCLPRVVSRWPGLSGGQGVFLQDRGGQEMSSGVPGVSRTGEFFIP